MGIRDDQVLVRRSERRPCASPVCVRIRKKETQMMYLYIARPLRVEKLEE